MKIPFFKKEAQKEERNCAPSTTEAKGPSAEALLFNTLLNRCGSMNISAFYKGVNMISDALATLPIRIRKRNGDFVEELPAHPLNLLFKNGSGDIMSKYTLIKLLVQSVILRGNGFAYIERANDGTPTAIRYLENGDVVLHYDKFKRKVWYRVNLLDKKKNVEPCDMLHFIKNTYDGVNGVSVISYANRSLNIANQSENNAKQFFGSGSHLTGVLSANGPLNNKQVEDIRWAWKNLYRDDTSGVAVLPGNFNYQAISVSPKDAQLLESRLFNVEEIARWLEINPILLGDLSHIQYNAIEAVQMDFLVHTLNPWIYLFEQELNRKLVKPSEEGIYIDMDEKAILRADKNATAAYYNSLLNSGVLSINEVRKELGYSPIEGGDSHTIAYSDVNQNTIEKGGIENETN